MDYTRFLAVERLTRPLRWTLLGLWAERLTRAFWPLWSILIATLAVLMLGLHEVLPLEALWSAGVVVILAALAAFGWGVRRFRVPTRAEALERLDHSLPGRPIAAVADTQAIGAGDAASEALWEAHVKRMTARLAAARAVPGDVRLAERDPFALRYVALLALVVALLFGSIWRVATVAEIAGGGAPLAGGPAWEGWIEPPRHTGRPSLYLADIDGDEISVPIGSRVTLRFYGEIGALALDETVSGRTDDIPPATDPEQSFDITRSGRISITGPGAESWQVEAEPDAAPQISIEGPFARGQGGQLELPFAASDDFGIEGGRMEITLRPEDATRRFGLAVDPDPREALVVDIPMPISGDRTDFEELIVEDFSKHPFANLPVSARLIAVDASGQEGVSQDITGELPGRRFFDPLARAIIEQRRDLLWSKENARRVMQVLRAVSWRPEEMFRSETAYLKLRVAVRGFETRIDVGKVTDAAVDEMAETLWTVALQIEEGDLSDALERLRRAQDRLAEAIENGASDSEIAELMEELRQAMEDYMRQLAEQAPQDGQQNQQSQNQQTITQDQLQQMLDRLQQLMEEGRMAEAQALLDQLRQMMENMQMAQNQQGQGGEGQQAMEGLAETLREQQGLSDEAFRDLQEQFGQQQQEGQQGQSGENRGRDGSGQGQGRDHGNQPGQQQGQGGSQGQPGQPGQPGGDGGEPSADSLADRQQALRDELGRQTENLPGAGTPEGDAARDSLGRAGEAMDDAEEALRENDLAQALDDQAEAMDALREGMQQLAEQMAQNQQEGSQQGQTAGRGDPQGARDPLGREAGENGRLGTDEQLLQGEDVYRRARELLDEIRRRSAERERSEEELDYLRRLLDRF